MDTPSQEPTQQNTQQVIDPRRLGRNNSGLNSRDVADVLLILHPASPGALRVVEEAAQHRRHHVLFHSPFDSDDDLVDIEEQETIIIDRPEARLEHTPRAGADLALRMSSRLVNPSLGFVFGRNPGSSDVVIGQESTKRLSNQHFRIYLNQDAVLMVEDMSTNGTIVDEVLLKGRDPTYPGKRMLSSGSIICIITTGAEMIKFVVRLPSRVSHADQFEDNVRQFMARCTQPGQQGEALQRIIKRQFGGPTMKWDGGDRYNVVGQLGKGAFATVYQLATKMEGKLVAAKELEKRRLMKNGQLDKKIDNEMRIMKDLRHPNIVEFIEYHDAGDYLYIIMEFVRCGDLQKYLTHTGTLTESQGRTTAQQMLSALNYLHRAKITHRDIKPDNILIAEMEPFTVKLSDFGLSKVVKHEETFLKTFCGTLLYCAPEVFPEFDTKPKKGTKRTRGAKQQFHSYSSSVDIWSFAAVLWFALCGKPPFEGIADATGQAMYTNIMTTPLDPNPLREAGISEPCIDLLCKMLQTDPALRPTPRDCLNHRWLTGGALIPDDPTLQSIVEEDESEIAEEQLSQLSLREEVQDSDDDDDDVLGDEEFEQLVSNRDTKRVRTDRLFPRNQIRDVEDSSMDASFGCDDPLASGYIVEDSFDLIPRNSGRPRLFGEIGQSALQSSGILSVHANEALVMEGGVGPEVTPQGHTRQYNPAEQPDATDQRAEDNNKAFSSPSLLGAESMVRELAMTSPQSPISGAHSPDEPATPKTPEMPQQKSLENPSLEASHNSESTPKAKPPTLNRQISLPKGPSFYWDPYDESTHTLEYASKVSGIDFVNGAAQSKEDTPSLPDTTQVSVASDGNSSQQTPQAKRASSVEISFSSAVLGPADMSIKPPPRRLGRLTATPDSFAPNLTLPIDHMNTSWGRAPTSKPHVCAHVYANAQDTRVPKLAFVIFFYNSEVNVEELAKHGKDWRYLKDLRVGITTGASVGISINGKRLRAHDENGRTLFGHLHSGDVITVYQDVRSAECLKFKCEFYLGLAKEPRSAGDSFHIMVFNGKTKH